MNMTDDQYLLKLMAAQKTDEFIAAKMGITTQEVRRRKKSLKKLLARQEQVNATDILKLQAVIGNQLELVGQSVKLIGSVLADRMEPADLRKIIATCPSDEDLASWIIERALVLRPFQLPSPEAILKATEQRGS